MYTKHVVRLFCFHLGFQKFINLGLIYERYICYIQCIIRSVSMHIRADYRSHSITSVLQRTLAHFFVSNSYLSDPAVFWHKPVKSNPTRVATLVLMKPSNISAILTKFDNFDPNLNFTVDTFPDVVAYL